MEHINLGILGVADVVTRSIIEPAKGLGNVKIYGIASRQKEKAVAYANKHNIPFVFEGYDALLRCKDIDAVYIPLINSLHAEWTIKAIEAGKHVLVEKPICLSNKEVEEIKQCIDDNPSVIVLEGLMIQHHPFIGKLLEIINSRIYGDLKYFKAETCYNLNDPNDFRLFPEKGGSVFFEEGILWCYLTQLCMNLDPEKIISSCEFNGPNKGDHTFKALLNYNNGISSELFCSYAHPYKADLFFEFEEATIKIKNIWRPTFGEQKLKFEIKKHSSTESEFYVFEPQSYFFNQLAFFVNTIQSRDKNISLKNSFERIKFMEKILKQSKNKVL